MTKLSPHFKTVRALADGLIPELERLRAAFSGQVATGETVAIIGTASALKLMLFRIRDDYGKPGWSTTKPARKPKTAIAPLPVPPKISKRKTKGRAR